jgi:putative mycofactocin binding protein MftB
VSTDPASFASGLAWQRTPTVVLRPEPFGALAYDFTSRRLSFLKTPGLARVVELLSGSTSALSALEASGVSDDERPAYLSALAALARSGMITRRADEEVAR